MLSKQKVDSIFEQLRDDEIGVRSETGSKNVLKVPQDVLKFQLGHKASSILSGDEVFTVDVFEEFVSELNEQSSQGFFGFLRAIDELFLNAWTISEVDLSECQHFTC
jgi:hypothetical protein